MNELQFWTSFFGWLTIVNIGIYMIAATMLSVMRDIVYRINAKIFRIDEGDVAKTAFKYVADFKLLITVFCFAPWLVLKLMA